MNWLWGIVSAVIVGLVVAWSVGLMNQVVPAPARARLLVENLFSDNHPRPDDGFRIVLCWLENDDSGFDTRLVELAFSGVGGIELVRSARIVAAQGASDEWREGMRAGVREALDEWNADLAIAGFVRKSGELLSLWFVPRSGDGTLGRADRAYRLDQVRLGGDFHDDFRAELASVALTVVAPLAGSKARGRVVVDGLEEAAGRLAVLLDGPTIVRGERRGALEMARGNALVVLGERVGDSEHLERAVTAYRAALEVRTRERSPIEWASTQNNLGIALRALGEREGDPERLERAVTAYRAALEVRTREHLPLDWASTQDNLGNALWTLGKWKSGTRRLKQAVAAYRAALEVRARERLPVDWAATQNNLGNALLAFGQRESGTERLEQAVAAYRAALDVFTRERGPRDWASTQNNLGTALGALGRRESGSERLEEAVAAYRAALEVRTRERLPVDWAQTQINLGSALLDLSRKSSGYLSHLHCHRFKRERAFPA